MNLLLRIKIPSVLITCALLLSPISSVQAAKKELSEAGYEKYVVTLKSEALTRGYDDEFVKRAFSKIKFHARAVKADRSQPENVETLDTYLPKRVPDWKVKKARAMYKKHLPLLTEIGKKYSVQPRFIVALWGLETNFGKIMGNYNVISALTTLAYEGRREVFFKKQLWAALNIIQQGHISVENMKGSWAGAMGQNQFMPTSFVDYAVDGDGDGKEDATISPACDGKVSKGGT